MKDVFKNLVPPPTAQLLGWELIDVDVEQGTIRIAFHPAARFRAASSRPCSMIRWCRRFMR
ncbi:hypothetical protein C050_03000 [Brucella suis 92/63]|nr:hypothetical protein C050_03000 [Brucella suis 92/63]